MVFAFHHVNVLGSNPYHKQKQKQQKNVESQMHGRFLSSTYSSLPKDLVLFICIYVYVCHGGRATCAQ